MRFRRAILGLALAAVLPSCGGGGGGGGGGVGDSFDRQALLANLATNLVVPTYQDFLAKAQALKTAADTYKADPAIPASLTAVQDAWLEANAVWQTAELLQFGPAGDATDIVGGQTLRDFIYSWPTHNPCIIDQELVAQTYDDVNFFAVKAVNVHGLDALEYLLFNTGPDNACSPPIGTDWTNLAAEIPQRRADYAAVLADHVLAQAQTLLNAWLPGATNFAVKFSTASTSGVYASAHAAVNDVFAAMFYLDKMVKDKKLGEPAGIIPLVPAGPKPYLVEAGYAGVSKENLRLNLKTFEIMFLGNAPGDPAGIGFDDFLTARGGAALAATMTADIADAIVKIDAIPVTIAAALQDGALDDQDPDFLAVLAAHAAIKKITDSLKTQFVTILNLSVPQTGAGDND